MERGKMTIYEMNQDELYAYALGAGTARMSLLRRQTTEVSYAPDDFEALSQMPEDLPREYADLYMSGFREVAAEAIAKTEHAEVA